MNIDDVFIWEKFRGKPIGELLMLKAKEVCLAKGASQIKWEVEQDNHGAIKFYERLGAFFGRGVSLFLPPLLDGRLLTFLELASG